MRVSILHMSLLHHIADKSIIALDALGENDLPIVTRRAIATYFDGDEGKKAWQEKLKSMFGHDYKFVWDFRAILSKLPKDSWCYDRKNEAVPELVSKYFSAAVECLERKNFGTDDMMQEGALRLRPFGGTCT